MHENVELMPGLARMTDTIVTRFTAVVALDWRLRYNSKKQDLAGASPQGRDLRAEVALLFRHRRFLDNCSHVRRTRLVHGMATRYFDHGRA